MKGPKDAGAVALKVVAVLGSFGIRVCDDQADIADIRIRGTVLCFYVCTASACYRPLK